MIIADECQESKDAEGQVAQDKIDEMKNALASLNPGDATSPSQVVKEETKIARIDLDLKVLSTESCTVDGPPPPPNTSGICAATPPKTAADDAAIDRVIDQINDGIKEATRIIENYEREREGGASTTAGQYADYYRTRIAQFETRRGYWDNIKKASCIPPQIPNLLRSILAGRTDFCEELCYETANWLEKLYPGPQGEYQKKTFFLVCGNNSCP